ncbi:uncharacterized Nudix hydrolase NudL-like isoform X2 [Dreissena polymorpha]|uniref:uncharacterized Nudix hydrolase NudL-like isoform X2 n=1 Tax=Dreissena polymorpha TaxID=45954 RepID=UPI002264EA30|nr:uncharacterized Nudix hydrolase NudL-like isoform X2 [Dreissena polymorpha]
MCRRAKVVKSPKESWFDRAMVNSYDAPSMIEKLKSRFKAFDIQHNRSLDIEFPESLFRQASVLIPLRIVDGEYNIILTVRSKQLRNHAGIVAFPGGMKDDTDADHIHTALREAEEEIGLPPEDVEVIAVLSPGITKPNSVVYPVIGIVKSDFQARRNESEVELVFELPLRRFLSSDRMRVEDFISPIKATYHVHHFVDTVQGESVDTWGFTAIFCVMTALCVYQSDQSFCFYEQTQVNKDTVFDPGMTRHMLQQMLKLEAKL